MNAKTKRYSQEYIEEQLKKHGFYMFNGQKYVNTKTKFVVYDNDGYIYSTTYDNLRTSGFNLHKVSGFNPYSILNIKRYLWLKDAKTTLIFDGVYKKNNQKLLFKCDCGREYEETWNHIYGSDRLQCKYCGLDRGRNNGDRKLHVKDIKEECEEKGLKLIYYNGNARSVHYQDKYGYKYNSSIFGVRNYKDNIEKAFCKTNPYTIENMKLFLKNNNIKTELLEDNSYKNFSVRNTKLKFKCSECGQEFYSYWDKVAYLNKRLCERCGHIKSNISFMVEDYLKSLNIEYETEKRYDDCRNKNPLPFDFYLPKYNYCIEVHGHQHYYENKLFKQSLEDRQKIDEIKKSYCKNNNIGYLEIPFWYIYNSNEEKERYKKEIDSIINQD